MFYNLWKKWCEKVKLHNDKLDYINYEETWSPYDILLPFLCASIISLFVYVYLKFNNSIYTLYVVTLVFVLVSLIIGILLWINWKINEK